MKKQSNRATGKTSNSGKSVKRTRRSVVKSTMLTGAGKNGIATERPRKNERVDWLNWRPSPYVPSRWPTTIITRTKPAAYTDCSSTTDGLWEGSNVSRDSLLLLTHRKWKLQHKSLNILARFNRDRLCFYLCKVLSRLLNQRVELGTVFVATD